MALLATAASSMAGGFFGPPPFDNGAPTSQGTDGTYQATAVANNLTGVISWVISGGQQLGGVVSLTGTSSSGTSATQVSTQNNSWVFFVDGQSVSGTPLVNVSQSKITGILDSSGANLSDAGSTLEAGGIFATDIPDNSAGGSFTASMNMNSPVLAFSGSGIIEGTPARADQLVVIQAININSLPAGTTLIGIPTVTATTVTISIPGSDLQKQSFRINGTRVGPVSGSTGS